MGYLGNEAEDEARDVESLRPLPRSSSWTKSWKIRVRLRKVPFSTKVNKCSTFMVDRVSELVLV
jgi:hypothetical protein